MQKKEQFILEGKLKYKLQHKGKKILELENVKQLNDKFCRYAIFELINKEIRIVRSTIIHLSMWGSRSRGHKF